MKKLINSAMMVAAAASVGGLGIAAHEKPVKAGGRRGKPRKLTQEEIDKMKASAEIARKGAQQRMTTAEIKRQRKAAKRIELIEKGAVRTLPEKTRSEAQIETYANAYGSEPAETKAQRDARKKREKRAAEKIMKAAA